MAGIHHAACARDRNPTLELWPTAGQRRRQLGRHGILQREGLRQARLDALVHATLPQALCDGFFSLAGDRSAQDFNPVDK